MVVKHRWSIKAVLLISFVAVTLQTRSYAADAPTEKCFMWKVSSATTTVYLLGSVHVGKEDFYPLPPEIENAFKASKFLAVELDPTKVDMVKLQAFIQEKGMYKGAETLSTKLSKESLKILTEYCAKSKMPIASLDKCKPWMVSMMITMMEVEKMGFKKELGIDIHFCEAAKKDAKTVLELETAESQLEVVSSLDAEVDAKSLAMMLIELKNMKAEFTALMEAWTKGDAAKMESIAIIETQKKYPEMKTFFEKMIDERNVKMLEKIEGYLKTSDVHFVVVGGAHLVGEKGLVKLLEGKKYKVEQVLKSSKPTDAKNSPPPNISNMGL